MSEINHYNQLLKTTKTVLSIDDLNQVWGGISRQTLSDKLNYLVNTGKLIRLKRGLYSLPDREIDPLELGTKAKSPSYISFYTVLASAGIIFQYHDTIYLASNNSEEMQISGKNFVYKKLKDEILYSPKGIENKPNYSIATPERAYLDTLYLNPGVGFDNEAKLDKQLCIELVDIYNNDRLTQEIKRRHK